MLKKSVSLVSFVLCASASSIALAQVSLGLGVGAGGNINAGQFATNIGADVAATATNSVATPVVTGANAAGSAAVGGAKDATSAAVNAQKDIRAGASTVATAERAPVSTQTNTSAHVHANGNGEAKQRSAVHAGTGTGGAARTDNHVELNQRGVVNGVKGAAATGLNQGVRVSKAVAVKGKHAADVTHANVKATGNAVTSKVAASQQTAPAVSGKIKANAAVNASANN